ncbi:MAG: tetratricopeptide repeat protein [Candidatus Odinarchaeota archaeon]
MKISGFDELFNQAKRDFLRGDFIEAASKLETAIDLANTPVDTIRASLELGFTYYSTGKYTAALKIFEEQLIQASREPRYDYGRARAFQGIGRVHFKKGDQRKALEFLKMGRNIFKNTNCLKEFLQCKADIGAVYFQLGDYDRSLRLLLETSQEQRKLEDIEGLTFSLNNIGLIHWTRGQYKQALDYFYENEKYHRESLNVKGISTALNNQAEVYRILGDLDKALRNYQQCLEIDEKIQDLEGIGISNHNIGLCMIERGEYNQAAEYLERSLSIFRRIEKIKSVASVLSDYACMEHEQGKYDLSKEHFAESLTLYEKLGSEEELVHKLCSYVELLLDMDEIADAELLLQKARFVAEKHSSEIEKLRVLVTESLLQKYKNNIGSAKMLFKKAAALAEQLDYYEMRIRINIYLAEILLSQFLVQSDEKQFDRAFELVTEASNLSLKQHMYPLYVKTLIIKGSLYAARLDFKGAVSLLEEAIRIAEENGITLLIIQANNQLEQINLRQTMILSINPESRLGYKKLALKDALTYMSSKTPFSLGQISQKDLNPEKIYITVFKQAKRGPKVLITDPLPFEKKESLFERIGFFYSMAVGQGHRHHEGLYGPLPFADEKDYLALVFSIALGDTKQIDDRMRGKNYCLFCIVYPNDYQEFFYNRSLIEDILRHKIVDIDDINKDITNEFLATLKVTLIEGLTGKKIEILG